MRNIQSPSTYSIYHNALPYYLDRVDICTVDDEGEQLATKFVDGILQKRLSVQVNASSLSAEKLRHLFFESKNYERVYGAKSFGFGYPMFVDSSEGDLLMSPLFIWMLAYEPAQTKVDSWILKFSETNHILPNYKIFKYLDSKYDIDLTKRAERLAFSHQLNRVTLSKLCDEIAGRLNFENNQPEHGITICPGIDELGVVTAGGALQWSGILGLFPPQISRWKPTEAKPEEVFIPTSEAIQKDTFVFPYLPSTPEQNSALETIFRNKFTIVESVTSNGRTEVVVNLLINALSNQKKCLVVSERAPALKNCQNLLAKAGLNQLNFLLDDALNDKLPMLELLRVASSGASRNIQHQENDFQLKKNKYLREKGLIDEAYHAVKKNVFGEYTWTETVGLFLASNRLEGKELLASQLNSQDFEFTSSEYESFKQGILKCKPLFQEIKTLSHPLSNLHESIFTKQTHDSGLSFVKEQIKIYLGKTAQLHHRFINKADNYAARLKEHYTEHGEILSDQLRLIQNKIADYGDKLGDDFKHAGGGGFHLPSFLSAKRKKIHQAQEDISRDFTNLIKTYSKRQYFDFQLEACKEGIHIPKTINNLDRFKDALNLWLDKLDAIVQDEVSRLNSKTAHPDLDSKEQITELEYSLDVLIEELNECNLYQKPLENKTLTIPQRQKYLESIIEQLETTQLNLRDFEIFYQWQSIWLKLISAGQKVIRALVKVKAKDWMAAFESWYFNNLLNKVHSSNLPTDAAIIDNLAEAWNSLKPLMLNQIYSIWHQKQLEHLKHLKKTNKNAYRLIFEKAGHQQAAEMDLGEIFDQGCDAITSILPVLFVTSHVALNVIPKMNAYFDFVIFDEANRFSVENATSIALLGNQVVALGSNDSNGSETSLLQYILESEIPVAKLDKLNNGYEKQEDTLPCSIKEFSVENVEGRFHERENTNDVEAQHIIRLLNQVKQTPQRVYPSVGIITTTVEQRNLIANYLLKLKQQNAFGSEKIQQLERNGLGVFYLDELFGQHFDLLIFSTTLGYVNLQGSLTKKMVFLNTPEGVSQLRLLINQTTQKLFIVHSIPDDQLEKFQTKPHEEGTFLLSHLIKLAEGYSAGNKDKMRMSLEALGKTVEKKASKSIFVSEIVNALIPYIGDKRLKQNLSIEGVSLPLVVKPVHKEEPLLVIHPDGFISNEDYTSCLWEFQQRETLRRLGISYHPTWSVNWLKNPGLEARLLASKIIKHDAQFQEPSEELKLKKGEI
jgi:hypothetical protein